MSERGSFVTSYMYCRKCFEAAKLVLCQEQGGARKYLCGVSVPHWNPDAVERELPIVAGKVGGLYSGEEIHSFENEFIPALEKLICHPIQIAVLADSGEARIFKVEPKLE